MKSILKNAKSMPSLRIFLFVSISLMCLNTFANKKDSILLIGKIYNNEERIKGVIINIFNKNKKIKVVHVRASNHFKTYLPKNALLTIEITAPNFHEKRIFFDSSIPDNLKKLPEYEFDLDIFSEKELAGVNTSFLDFPVGLVKYNPKKKAFLRDKNYTKKMKKRLYELLEEAELSERATLKGSD